ncbi:MAG: hypothetical protein ABFS86_16415 [Planctomycetota bacterium]
MKSVPLLIALLALAGCVSPDRPVDRRDRYLDGYAAPGPVEPEEFAYEDDGASPRFPPPAQARTFTVVDGKEEAPASTGKSSPDAEEEEETRNEYRENEYGGSGWPPRPPFARPPRPR